MATIYVAMPEGLLRAHQDEDGWALRRTLEELRVECLATPADGEVLVGTFDGSLYRVPPGGGPLTGVEGWDRAIADVEAAVTALAVSPHDPGVWYVGTEPSAVYRTVDDGASFTRLDGLNEVPSAEEWSFPPRPETHHVRTMAVDQDEPDRLYVGIEAGAFVYTPDGGETWIDRPDGSCRDNHEVQTHPGAVDRVFAAAGDGFAASTDRGETFTRPEDGLDHRYCWSLAIDPDDPDRSLLSAASGARTAHRHEHAEAYLYRRSGGGPWERLERAGIPAGDGVTRSELAVDPDSGTVYAASNRGLFRTADFGTSWGVVPVRWPEELREQTPRDLLVVP